MRKYTTARTTTVAVNVDSAPSWSPDGTTPAFIAGLPDTSCGEQAVFTVPATGAAAPSVAYNLGSDNTPARHRRPRARIVHRTQQRPAHHLLRLPRRLLPYRRGHTDPSAPAARRDLEIRCSEESTPVDGIPGTCDYGLHLSDAQIGPGGNGVVSSGKGGEPPLPGSSSFPMGTLEKVYAVNRRRGGPAPGSTAASGHSPTWSPNGGAVIFTQRSATSSKVMRVSGSSATATATVLIPNASQPDWQPVR